MKLLQCVYGSGQTALQITRPIRWFGFHKKTNPCAIQAGST